MTYLKVIPGLRTRTTTARREYDYNPAVDIVEDKDSFSLEFDLPGLRKDDIKITVNEGVLAVSGERKRDAEEDEKNFRHFERNVGTFSRSFRLPDYVDGDSIKAAYKNGVLRLVLPKKAEAKPYTIEIK